MWLPVGDGSYRHTHFKKEFNFMLIGLTQQTTRSSGSSNKTREKLMLKLPAIEAKTELIEVGL